MRERTKRVLRVTALGFAMALVITNQGCTPAEKLVSIGDATAGVSTAGTIEVRDGVRSASSIDVPDPKPGAQYEVWVACTGSGQIAVGGAAGRLPFASIVRCPVNDAPPYVTRIPPTDAAGGGYHLTAVASKVNDWWVLLVLSDG